MRIINVNNEYGRLRDAFIGIGDEKYLMHPTYMDAFKWQDAQGMEECEKYGGQLVVETTPEVAYALEEELNNLAVILEERGIEVFRSHPLQHEEEITYLDNVQIRIQQP